MLTNSTSFMPLVSQSEEQEFGEIRELLVRPWWSRAWVVQEAVLAKSIVLMQYLVVWGNRVIHVVWSPIGSTYMFPDMNYNVISALRALWQERGHEPKGGLGQELDFLGTLFILRSMQATDPRDRIYSFLGLAHQAFGEAFVADYSAPVATVYETFARQAIETTKSLDTLDYKREWADLGNHDDVSKPAYAYSVLDQSKYHDDFAFVLDKPDSKPRRDWARSPPGWERDFADKSSRQLPPQLVEHFTKRRVCSPGWVKSWDNLGRVSVAYAPNKGVKHNAHSELHEELSNMPPWVPSWATSANYDPERLIAMLAKNGSGHWFTANHDACNVEKERGEATSSDELTLEGMSFDAIEHLGTAWHPGDSSPPISAGWVSVFSEWVSLAETAHADMRSPYGYRDMDITRALGRTILIDPLGEELSRAEDGKLFRAWLGGVSWDTLEMPRSEANSVTGVIRNVVAFSALEERMGEYYCTVIRVDDDAMASEKFEASKSAKFSMINDFNSLTSNTSDGTFSYRTPIKNMYNQGSPEKILLDEYGVMITRIKASCAHRAFFVTKRGYFGLAPWNAQVGDKIYSLKGGKAPFLLRPVPSRGADAIMLVVGLCERFASRLTRARRTSER
ncbi:hypothetical protein BJ170DRAFT_725591 [Xylariales sp. AK1849]|nr:hypothetical protein BJ170DRAFT_725591 [Xylariales sp. AK1849]